MPHFIVWKSIKGALFIYNDPKLIHTIVLTL